MSVHATRGRRRGNRKTYSVVLAPERVAPVDHLVASGIYRSRSHAVEEALRLLAAYHRDRLPATEEADRAA